MSAVIMTIASVIALAREYKMGFRRVLDVLLEVGSPLSEPVTQLAQILGLVAPYKGQVSLELFSDLLAEAAPVLNTEAPAEELLGYLAMDRIPLSYGLLAMGAEFGMFSPACCAPNYRDCEMDPRSEDPYCIPMSNRARTFMMMNGIHSKDAYKLGKRLGIIAELPSDVQAELYTVLAHWEEAA